MEGRAPMFMHEMYNVEGFYPHGLGLNNCAIAVIRNALVKAVNGSLRLPRHIIFIPDKNILEWINFNDYGISHRIGRCLSWMINDIQRIIQARRDALWRRRQGAVLAAEPKLIWVKMIDRPIKSKIMATRAKYNAILEDLLASREYCYIMDVQGALLDNNCFDRIGKLSASGRAQFWNEINMQLKDFDRQRSSLKPKKLTLQSNTKNSKSNCPNSGNNNNFRLPPPPPNAARQRSNGSGDPGARSSNSIHFNRHFNPRERQQGYRHRDFNNHRDFQ